MTQRVEPVRAIGLPRASLRSGGDPAPIAELLERYAAATAVTPRADLAGRIAAAVASLPQSTPPRRYVWALLAWDLRGLTAAFRQLLLTIRQPAGLGMAVRAQSMALVLATVLAAGALAAGGALGVVGLVQRLAPQELLPVEPQPTFNNGLVPPSAWPSITIGSPDPSASVVVAVPESPPPSADASQPVDGEAPLGTQPPLTGTTAPSAAPSNAPGTMPEPTDAVRPADPPERTARPDDPTPGPTQAPEPTERPDPTSRPDPTPGPTPHATPHPTDPPETEEPDETEPPETDEPDETEPSETDAPEKTDAPDGPEADETDAPEDGDGEGDGDGGGHGDGKDARWVVR